MIVRLLIHHHHLESLYGNVLVEICHKSRARDSKIGTAIIPLSDMKNGEGPIQIYDVDPVGKVGVALMRKKREPVLWPLVVGVTLFGAPLNMDLIE